MTRFFLDTAVADITARSPGTFRVDGARCVLGATTTSGRCDPGQPPREVRSTDPSAATDRNATGAEPAAVEGDVPAGGDPEGDPDGDPDGDPVEDAVLDDDADDEDEGALEGERDAGLSTGGGAAT
jgi:hypothetical protein